MLDAIRFLGCVNSAQLYSISTGVKVGVVYYADDVQKAFIHTGTGWAQLTTASACLRCTSLLLMTLKPRTVTAVLTV